MGVISRFSINCGKLSQNEEGHPGHKVLNWQWSFRRLRLVNHYVFQTVSSFLEAYRFCPQPALPSLNITCLFFYSIEARQDLLSGSHRILGIIFMSTIQRLSRTYIVVSHLSCKIYIYKHISQ